MMTRYLSTSGSAATSAGAGPCGCGQPNGCCGQEKPPACCGRCERGRCECDTGCLSRPHFYCGMVLTDDQLNDLTQWVRRRSALHRYVEGWGVVRGLAVRCNPVNPGCVVVGPGYARSCYGDDIVVCDDICLDVCACPPPGPCCDDSKEPAPGQERPRAVDIYLQYTEKPEDPATVMAACGCGGHDGAQYERVAEGGTLTCVPVDDPDTDPATLAAREWDRGYRACSSVVTEYQRVFSDKNGREEDRLKWILRWIDQEGDDALCCIRRWLCRNGLGKLGASGALLEIVSARRNRYLETTYGECACPKGVLLARVWLSSDEDGRCAVECIDSHPPFRRVIRPSGWPQMPGFINVAELIWQRRTIACEQARTLGLRVSNWYSYKAPGKVTALADWYDNDSAFLNCDTDCNAWLYRDRCGHWVGDENDNDADGRVLGLRSAG